MINTIDVQTNTDQILTNRRKVIVHIGTSADGYIARQDGDLEWLTSRCVF